MNMMIPVVAAPMIDPSIGRIDLEVNPGLTISEIIREAMPRVTMEELTRTRVVLFSREGSIAVEAANWMRVRPKSGVRVVIRIIPGKGALSAILSIVVSIAAVALGQYWALGLGFQAGTTGYALVSGAIGLGVSVVGNLLINALIPPEKPKDDERKNSYSISGWKNRLEPNGIVPDVLGKIRFAPPFACPPYTEIVGDLQYIRAVFCFGYGGPYGVALSEFRIGETKIEEYDEVEMEVREGLATDQPLKLYPRQIVEESIGVELTRLYPRDDAGNVIPGSTPEEKPTIRSTGASATGGSIIFSFPGGWFGFDRDGNRRPWGVDIRIRQRLAGTEVFSDVTTLNFTFNKQEAFHRQYSWTFPSRGRWEIEVTRMTPEVLENADRYQGKIAWSVLQTVRPEYPLNFGKPLALVSVRVKATYQLQGQLDNFNAIASRRCLDWSIEDNKWVVRETSSPGALLRYVLQGPANPKPVPTNGIDLAQLQALSVHCRLKGLKYDRVVQDRMQLRDLLTEIAGAGRALPRHDGIKWGVIIDRPQTLPIAELNPRNSWDFRANRTYVDPPHAFRVQFLDATNDFKPAERLVPWPGHSGSILITEAIDLPGKTDPKEIWIEARRRMFEAIYRPDVYTCMQDGPASVATRGDLVMVNTDVLVRAQQAGRVKTVNGWLIELDNEVTMVTGQSYAVRFRRFTSSDTIGTSVVRQVVTQPGRRNILQLVAGGVMPEEGMLVQFGPSLNESFPMVVTRVESGTQMSSMLQMADAAPIIDEFADAEVPPAWSGLVGDDIGDDGGIPPAPKITGIRSGLSGAGAAGAFRVELEPGTGSVSSRKFRVEHRLVGASDWSFVEFAATAGGVIVNVYNNGDPIQIRAAAISSDNQLGPYTNVVSVTIGASDAPAASPLDPAMVSIGALLGGAVIQFSTPADPAIKQVQIYRSVTGAYNPATNAVGDPISVSPSRSFSIPDGDATRQSLISNGGFDSAAVWTLGAGWSIAAGKAAHASGGGAGGITQPITVTTGKWYRTRFTVSNRLFGLAKTRLYGGTQNDGANRTTDGTFRDRIQANAGNNQFGIACDGPFDGSIDDVVIFEETSTCLPQGLNNYWIETFNADGLSGGVVGPFPVTVT